jgi:hypothetical protein
MASASEGSYTGWIVGTVIIVVVFAIAAAFWFNVHGFP